MISIRHAPGAAPGSPALRQRSPPPPGATDCHAHVFGPFAKFPLARECVYTPPELPAERYIGMLDELGFSRGVLIQPIAHGTDCGALLHALSSYPERLRGIALIGPDVTDAELEAMNRMGVRGARFSRPPDHLASTGTIALDALPILAPRMAELGWHAEIFTFCDHLVAIAPKLTALGLPIVVDHLAMLDPARGVDDAAFKELLRLLAAGRLWLKLTAYRLSSRYPDYEDLRPFHEAVLGANPERLIWGSDWPHIHVAANPPRTAHLVELFERWTGDEALRRRILVDNPAALYGFR